MTLMFSIHPRTKVIHTMTTVTIVFDIACDMTISGLENHKRYATSGTAETTCACAAWMGTGL